MGWDDVWTTCRDSALQCVDTVGMGGGTDMGNMRNLFKMAIEFAIFPFASSPEMVFCCFDDLM